MSEVIAPGDAYFSLFADSTWSGTFFASTALATGIVISTTPFLKLAAIYSVFAPSGRVILRSKAPYEASRRM
jgi:hypothetical protein